MTRVQRKRIAGYRMPNNTVYVGRPTKYGNPFRLSPDGWIQYRKGSSWYYWSVSNGFSIRDVLELYEQWLSGELKSNVLPLPPQLENLRGKNLSCWCPVHEPCHADILLRLANQEKK